MPYRSLLERDLKGETFRSKTRLGVTLNKATKFSIVTMLNLVALFYVTPSLVLDRNVSPFGVSDILVYPHTRELKTAPVLLSFTLRLSVSLCLSSSHRKLHDSTDNIPINVHWWELPGGQAV